MAQTARRTARSAKKTPGQSAPSSKSASSSKSAPAREKQAPEKVALVLQGGGALGAYQAGTYEELHKAQIQPDWIAGISIGAINAAIIAGNPPEDRVARLRTFWQRVSSGLTLPPIFPGEQARTAFNEASAALAATFGLPGFFKPRVPPAVTYPPGAPEALSFYDTSPLRDTLLELVDFDRINTGGVRLSVGAVNLRTGNFVYFDSKDQPITPEHIMASGALPPGFPPVSINGELYWDGGLVSNTPLQYLLDVGERQDTLVFQIDVFSARGPLPRDLTEVAEREKDIRYSSRTRFNTDAFERAQTMRRSIHQLLSKLPDDVKSDPSFRKLEELSCNAAVTIVHLIHRRKNYESQSKDYEFSRETVQEHWQSGRDDVVRTLQHKAWRDRQRPADGVAVFDLTREALD